MTIPAIQFPSDNPLRDACSALNRDIIRSGATGKEFQLLRDDSYYFCKEELISLIGGLNKEDFCELMNSPYDLSRADSYNNLPEPVYSESAVHSDQLVRIKITNLEYDFNNPLYPASPIPSDYNPYSGVGEIFHISKDYLRENCVIDFLEEWIFPLFLITKLEYDMFPSFNSFDEEDEE